MARETRHVLGNGPKTRTGYRTVTKNMFDGYTAYAVYSITRNASLTDRNRYDDNCRQIVRRITRETDNGRSRWAGTRPLEVPATKIIHPVTDSLHFDHAAVRYRRRVHQYRVVQSESRSKYKYFR